VADYYQLLGVSPDASVSEIRQAYLRLARDKHPDRFGDAVEKRQAEALFQDITTAFNTLMNPRSREEYDEARQRPQALTPAEQARDAFTRGESLLAAGDFDASVAAFRVAVHLEPARAAYHVGLGRALGRTPRGGREAVQVLERATQIDPANAAVLAELAAALARQGLRLRAQRALEAAQRLAPGDPRTAQLARELGFR
jgi:curved DNA-binding protein CbpA